MSIIYVLIPIAVLLTAIGIYLFFWAVKTDQFDDLEKQGMSILFDSDIDEPQINNSEIEEFNIDGSDINTANSNNAKIDNQQNNAHCNMRKKQSNK